MIAEASNLFNHSNATGYNVTEAVFTSAAQGIVGNVNPAGLASNLFQSNATRDPRYIQLGFRLSF